MTSTSLQSPTQGAQGAVPSLHELRADQLKKVRMSHEELGKRLARRMAAVLRLPVEISLDDLTSENLSSLFGRLEESSTVAELRLPAGSTALLILENSACSSIVECMLGGIPKQPHPVDNLSSVELKILLSVFNQLTCEFNSSWFGTDSAELSISGVFHKPEVATRKGGNIQHLVFSYTLSIGGLESAMQIALPFEAILRILDSCNNTKTLAAPKLKISLLDDMAAPLLATPVDVDVLLDGGTIRLGVLSELAPGSLLLLDTGLETQAEAVMNGSVRLAGRVVRQGPKRLFRFSGAHNLV